MFLLGFEMPLWALLSASLAVTFLWWSTSTFSRFKEMGIPYRTPVPFFGNSLSLFTKSVVELQVTGFKKFGKMYGQFDGRTANLMIADADFVKEMGIKAFPSFSNRRKIVLLPNSVLQQMLTLIDDDHWRHVRSSITPVFTSGKLKQMVAEINECGDRFIEHLKKTASVPCTVKNYTAGYTMDVIASTAFGIKVDSQTDINHPFLKHAGAFFGGGPGATRYTKYIQMIRFFIAICSPRLFRRILQAFGFRIFPAESSQYFTDIVNKILEQRMETNAEKRPDFVQSCVDKFVDLDKVDKSSLKETSGLKWSTEGITREEIISNAVLFLVAGYETTATTLQFFFYQMAKSPEIQKKLYEHIKNHSPNDKVTYEELNKMDYLDQCLHEVLRLYPPGLKFDRVASADTEVNGISIPKGMVVTVNVYAIHHNPEYWPEPETFKPERFAPDYKEEHHQYSWLPFGIGNRSCIGMRLALLEVKLGIVKVMKHYLLEKSASTPETLEFRAGTTFLAPKSKLEIRVIPKHNK